MRELAEAGRIQAFMREIGKAAREETRVYFTGGTSAVLLGWRGRTIAVHRADVAEMLHRRLITAASLREMFEAIRPSLYRYPAIDAESFRRALDDVLAGS